MFNQIFGLIQAIYKEISEAKLIEVTGLALTVITFISPIFLFLWKQYRLQQVEKEQLDSLCKTREKQIKNLGKQIAQVTKDKESLESCLLHFQIEEARKERKEGNEERAINILTNGLKENIPHITGCCIELALHHLSLLPDYGNYNIFEAERMAKIANLLNPTNNECQLLLSEIIAVKSELENDQGNYYNADILWDEATRFLISGENSSQTVSLLQDKATDFYKNGQFRIAERIYRRALIIANRSFEPNTQISLTLRSAQAMCFGYAGRHLYALELFNNLLPDMERILGKDHLNTLIARNNIALWMGQNGNYEQALEMLHILKIDQARLLGVEHRETFVTRGNIADLTGENGNINDAVSLFESLLQDEERVLGPKHPNTLTTRNNLAFWIEKTGEKERALELFKALLLVREEVKGKFHPDSLVTRSNIASITGKAGNPTEALKLLKLLLPDQEGVLGKMHPETLKTRGNIATGEGEMGNPREALALSKQLLEDIEHSLGNKHPLVLTTKYCIANWIARLGNPKKAYDLLNVLLKDQDNVLGKMNPDTQNTIKAIDFWSSKII